MDHHGGGFATSPWAAAVLGHHAMAATGSAEHTNFVAAAAAHVHHSSVAAAAAVHHHSHHSHHHHHHHHALNHGMPMDLHVPQGFPYYRLTTYTCPNENCTQRFQNVSSYKRHLIRAHSKTIRREKVVNKIESLNCAQKFCISNTEKNDLSTKEDSELNEAYPKTNEGHPELSEFHSELNEVHTTTCNIFDIKIFKLEYLNKLTEFTLLLHNNNNFTRKDVIDLQNSITKFLIHPLLNGAIKKLDEFDTKCQKIHNFAQGRLWQEKKKLYSDKTTVPYFLYIDDFEINNPLGSHSGNQAITAIYFSFPTLECFSKLNDIYLAALIKAKDIKKFGNDLTINSLIEKLISLELNGLNLTLDNKKETIHFILGLVLGDNLGLNQVLELSKSFSATNFCRFCVDNKDITKVLAEENMLTLRNEKNYNESLTDNPDVFNGVLKNSLLNTIPSFHVTRNFAVDLMHDIFEDISFANIKKKKFNLSAREMWCLIHHFPLMVAHLIPANDEVWIFLCTFVSLIDSLLMPSFDEHDLEKLQKLIKFHNTQYVRLFGDDLKPKHHLLIHYPRIIQYSGPPKFFWSFRYEGKHRELKSYAKVITSRKNVLLSIATKFQIKFAYQFLKKDESDVLIYLEIHKCICKSPDLLPNKLKILHCNVVYFKQVIYNGILYKKGHFLSITKNSCTIIYEIEECAIVFEKNLYITCRKKSSNFLDHYVSFEIIT
ncbi:uncharacterized protein LOC129609225 [Condylostylus longicornis]|uniref:uncharacterized protein LOC129609225 n=1 Tax=Condylostylus longicornis TaxID=2530218 RepID=UPI00244DC4E6|nr:uncharacterized protein LOC129609225 [Condylostylus longicornis]